MSIELYTPISKDYEKKIDDFHLDVISETVTGGANTITLGTVSTLASAGFTSGRLYTITFVGTTDFTAIGSAANVVGVEFVATGAGSGTGTATNVVTRTNHCNFAFGVNRTDTPDQVSISTPGTGAVSSTVVINGGNAAHDVFIFGGERGLGAGDAFYFNQYNGQNSPSDFLWELIELTLSGTNEVFQGVGTGDEDLSIISRPMYVMLTEKKATPPDTAGVSVNEISSIDFHVYGGSNATMLCLVGGLRGGIVPADDTGTDAAVYRDRSFLLPNAKNVYARPKNALIGEIFELQLNNGSPSKAVTPPTTTNLNFIKNHIVGLFPMSLDATETAIAWDGTSGSATDVTSANTQTQLVRCLVVGY
jgi:hypothetical protein